MNDHSLVTKRNLCLLVTSTLTVMAGATISPSLPGMLAAFPDYQHTELMVKLILSIPGLCIVIAAPFIGHCLDNIMSKPVLLSALMIYGTSGSVGYFYNDSLWALLLGRIALGFAVAAIMVTCISLAGRYFKGASLGAYMGLQAAFGGFGGVVFLAAAGFLAEHDWRAPFLIYAAAFLIIPACAILLNEPQKPEPTTAEQLPSVVDKSTIVTCYALAFLEMFMLYLIPLHFPFYILEISSASSTATGISIASMLLTSATVSATYKYWGGYLSAANLHCLGLLIAALGIGNLALATGFWTAYLSLIIFGVGLGIIRPNVIVWLFSAVPPQLRGSASGKITSFFFIGQVLCPILTQPYIEIKGYSSLFVVSAVTLPVVAIAIQFKKTYYNKHQACVNSGQF